MNQDAPHPPKSSTVTGKSIINRHELAAQLDFSLRYVDKLTCNGSLPYFKIGKSVRYDLDEVLATLRDNFHVNKATRRASK